MKLETVPTGKQFFEMKLHEKELQLEKSIHEEITLKAENQKLKRQIEELEFQLKSSELEKQNFAQQTKELGAIQKETKEAARTEGNLVEELKNSKAELSVYKQKTFNLLEDLRPVLQELTQTVEKLESSHFKLEKQLKKKEQEFEVLNERYQKVLNTKTMKWTGKYWKLRKKILLKSK